MRLEDLYFGICAGRATRRGEKTGPSGFGWMAGAVHIYMRRGTFLEMIREQSRSSPLTHSLTNGASLLTLHG